jgi:serine/threonine protein kinase
VSKEQWGRVFSLVQTLSNHSLDDAIATLNSFSEDPEVVREVLQTLEDRDVPDAQVSLTGRRFGRYDVGERIGSGSCGDVYRGRDILLGRPVALKFVSSTVLLPKAAAHRLVGEAQAASGLNHPNIVTVYEVLETEAGPVIAMELVDGQSLRSRLRAPILKQQALHYTRQLLEALAAAHASGIVHRDIKPENVIVRPDGYLKVLDFGLARQMEPTENGAVWSTGPAGTLRYMSPEQYRGENVTAASDMFSAGLVLFEMAAGRHPFGGETPVETADLIQRSSPPAKAKGALQSLALLLLSKTPQARPTAAQALQLLKTQERRGKFRKLAASIAAGLMLAAPTVFYLRRDRAYAPINEAALTSNLGVEDSPDLSPDGKAIVYTYFTDTSGSNQLMIKRFDRDSPTILLKPGPGENLLKPVWSPDSTHILFEVGSKTGSSLWTIAADNTGKRKIGDLVSADSTSGVDWAPNARLIAYSDGAGKNDPHPALHLLDLTTGNRTVLTHPPDASTGDFDPKFSPDGRTIAFKRSFGRARDDLFAIPVEGGVPRKLTTGQQWLWGHAWTPDSKTLITARKAGGHAYDLWQTTLDETPKLQIFREVGTDNILAPAVRAGRVAWVNGTDANTVFRIPVAGGKPEIVTGSTSLDSNPTIAPDGRIAFVSRRSGSEEIWIAQPDGSNPVRVTNLDQAIGRVMWSPDGRQLLFDSQSVAEAFVMQCDAVEPRCAPPRRITPDKLPICWPLWSLDGNSIYFTTPVDGVSQIVRMSGSEIQPVTHGDPSYAGQLSPDGTWLYFARPGSIWRTQLNASPYREELVLGSPFRPGFGHFTLTSDELIFWDLVDPTHPSTIRALNPNTKRMRTVFETENSYSPALSRDGRTLYYAGTDRKRGHIIIMVADLSH